MAKTKSATSKELAQAIADSGLNTAPSTISATCAPDMRSPLNIILDAVEVLENILLFLPPQDILRMKSVSTYFRDVVKSSPTLQQRLFVKQNWKGECGSWFLEVDNESREKHNIVTSAVRESHVAYPKASAPSKVILHDKGRGERIYIVNPLLLRTLRPKDPRRRYPAIHKTFAAATARRFKLYKMAEGLDDGNDSAIPLAHLRQPNLHPNASCRQMQLASPPVEIIRLEILWVKKQMVPVRGRARIERRQWYFTVKNSNGVTFGDVYDRAQRVIARSHADMPHVYLRMSGLQFVDGFPISEEEHARLDFCS